MDVQTPSKIQKAWGIANQRQYLVKERGNPNSKVIIEEEFAKMDADKL